MGYKSLAQTPARRNRPVSSNVRRRNQKHLHLNRSEYRSQLQPRLHSGKLLLGQNLATKDFTSSRGDDDFKILILRRPAKSRNASLEMVDKSVRQAIDSRGETYIRSVIRPRKRNGKRLHLHDWKKYAPKPQLSAFENCSCN